MAERKAPHRAPTVRVQMPVLRRCDECGLMVPENVPAGMHAPHHVTKDGQRALVNCVGEVLVYEDSAPSEAGHGKR